MNTTTSPTITGATAGAITTGITHTFSSTVRRLAISLIPSSASVLFVKINGSTCSATNWDFLVTAGVPYVSKDRHINFTKVCLYCADNLTNGMDYVVKGIV